MADDDDPWYWINFRYANDELAQFALVFDAIEDVVSKLCSANVADQRLALISADYAADVLLARRVAQVIGLSEGGPFFEPRERFDSHARGMLRQRFNRRVAVAATDYSRRFTLGFGEPILDESDAEVLKVAHAYRNDAYHADRHNENTLPIIAAAAVHAVSRAWMRSLSPKTASSHGANGPVMRRLEEKGYDGGDWADGKMFSRHAGAATVTRWLERELPIDPKAQRGALTDDIAGRVAWANSMVDWLSSGEGPGRDEIEPGLRWNDFWRQHGDDPDFLQLDEARSEAYERAFAEKSEELDAAARDAEAAYLEHFRNLMSAHQPSLSLKDLPRLARRGAALSNAKTQGALFGRYRGLDAELRVFEETLGDLAIGWDRAVEEESERRRGK
jgi:hypothetical protein